MGLETYLFKVEFDTPIQGGRVVELFESIGMNQVFGNAFEDETLLDNSCYFEQRTNRGLTEVECIISTEKSLLDNFSIRFSIISPKIVIEQTFELMKKLNDITPIVLFDTELYNHLHCEISKKGDVYQWLKGLMSNYTKTAIERKCYIPIDLDAFKQTSYGIANLELILSNCEGEVIESG